MIRSLSTPAPPVTDRATLVLFSVGQKLVGAPVDSVERVLRAGSVRALAESCEGVAGAVEHAGRLVPVLGLRARLAEDDRYAAASDAADRRTLVLARGTTWFAVEVDAVHEIVAVDAVRIQPQSAGSDAPVVPHVLGEIRLDERLVRVLNVGRLLTTAEWEIVVGFPTVAPHSDRGPHRE